MARDTEAIHLADTNGKPLCDAGPDALVLMTAEEWAKGSRSAGQGARICGTCVQKAEAQ